MQLVSLKDVGDELDATDDVSYLALYISDAAAGLVGLEDVLVFNAWGIGVLVNSVSAADVNADPDKIDWTSFTVNGGIELPDLTQSGLTAEVDVSISGAAELNVLDGLVVLKVTGFEMTLGTVSGDDTNTFLVDAQALTVTLTGVDLWVGPGGSLDEGDDANDLSDSSTFDDDTVVSGIWASAATWARCSWCR